jgi:hypothetical protein
MLTAVFTMQGYIGRIAQMPGVLSYSTAILTGMSHYDPPHDLIFVNVLESSATAPERHQKSIHHGAVTAITVSGHAPAVNVPQQHK